MENKFNPPKAIKKDLSTTIHGKIKTQINHNLDIKCLGVWKMDI